MKRRQTALGYTRSGRHSLRKKSIYYVNRSWRFIARLSGISRETLRRARHAPESATLLTAIKLVQVLEP